MNFKEIKRKFKKTKKYNCIVNYKQSLYSNRAEVEMYGSDYDLQLAMVGIILSYIQRGNSIEDIKEIIKKIENDGNEVF